MGFEQSKCILRAQVDILSHFEHSSQWLLFLANTSTVFKCTLENQVVLFQNFQQMKQLNGWVRGKTHVESPII